jgi:hypothetical protein
VSQRAALLIAAKVVNHHGLARRERGQPVAGHCAERWVAVGAIDTVNKRMLQGLGCN